MAVGRMGTDSGPPRRGRRERPAEPALSRDGIAATAAEQATRDQSADTQAEWGSLADTLHGTSARTPHPHIASLASQLVSGTAEQRMSWGLATLINGIGVTPVPAEDVSAGGAGI